MNSTDCSAALVVSEALRVRQSVAPRGIADVVSLRFNQLCALVLIILFSPLMLVVSWLIWRRDGSPIFFAHYRVGRDGKLFRCLKFRSMYRESDRMLKELLATDPQARAEWARDQKLSHDPRITPIGHLLRRTSLDELPQLFNVLCGEMSLVGPRPITKEELARYGGTRWHYLSVRPGLTGLWQVSGRNEVSYAQRVALDREYVEHRSFAMNLSILFKTFSVVVSRNGAR